MNATRTDPRQHCWARPLTGAYVTAANTTAQHLAAVFAAERARLAQAGRKPRQRKPRSAPAQAQLQLLLVG